MNKTHEGETLLCRTQYNANSIAGRIYFSPEAINVRLVGFEEFIYLRREDNIELQLEDGKFCTITPASTSPGSISTAVVESQYLDINARRAIIGFRPWDDNDLVQDFHFGLSDLNGLVTAPDIKGAIESADWENPPETKIFEATSSGTTVLISFSYTRDWHIGRFKFSKVVGKATFENAKTISELSDFVGVLQTFFTMAAGIEVQLSDYWVLPKERCEEPLLGGGSMPAFFRLFWPSGSKQPLPDYGSIRPDSVLRSWEDADRKITSDCLKFWMDSWAEWKNAFLGLLIASREGRIFDSHRIVNACKWLESTPGTKQIKLDVNEQLNEIAGAAIEKSNQLGLDIKDRIFGAIMQLGTESRDDLFRRLIDRVISSDDQELKERFRKDLHKAYRIRGTFAHNKFDHSNDEDFGDYVQSTRAVEALAFLLLLREMPFPGDYPRPHSPSNFTGYFLP